MGPLRQSLRQHILLSTVSLIIPQKAWLKKINKPGMPAGTSKHRFAVTFVGAIRYAQIFNTCGYSFNPRPRGPPARDKPNPTTARVLVPFSWPPGRPVLHQDPVRDPTVSPGLLKPWKNLHRPCQFPGQMTEVHPR